MKKTLIALAAVAASGAVFAQSSVTLFGNVDVNVRQVKQGGQSRTSMAKNGISSSAVGLRGVEDLGGGLKAGFHLEGDITPDHGTAGTGNAPTGLNFERRSTVSLLGGFGELRLGRDYTPTFWIHTRFDPFVTNGLGSSLNTFTAVGSDASTTVRANNSIGYLSPNWGGFAVQVQYAFKEDNASNAPNEYAGFSLTYGAGPLALALASASEGATAGSADSFKRTNFAAAYDFGFIRPVFQYTQGKFGANKVNHVLLGLTAPVGPGKIKASYIRSDYNAAFGNNDANQIALGYDYSLSKRTTLYGNYARINNKNGATFGVASMAAGNAAANPTAGGRSSGFEVGIRHVF